MMVVTTSKNIYSLNEFDSLSIVAFGYLGMHDTPLPDVSKMRGKWKVASGFSMMPSEKPDPSKDLMRPNG